MSKYIGARDRKALFALWFFQLIFVVASILDCNTAKANIRNQISNEGKIVKNWQTTAVHEVAGRLVFTMLLFAFLAYAVTILLNRLEILAVTIVIPVFLLCSIGLVYQTYTAFSHSKAYALLVLGGCLAMLLSIVLSLWIRSIPIKITYLYIYLVAAYLGTLVSLVLGIVTSTNGAGGNIEIFGMNITPGVLFKLAVILFFAFSQGTIRMNRKICALFLGLCLFMSVTLLLVNDTGNALILLGILMVMLLYSFGPVLSFCAGIVAAVAGVIGYEILEAIRPSFYTHISKRLHDWGKLLTSNAANRNARRALLSIVRSGLAGTGLSNSTFATFNYASETDYVFSAILSIWGIGFGIIIVLCLSFLVISLGMSKRAAGNLSDAGISNLLMVVPLMQALVHMGGNLDLIPFTGVTFPFLSFSGTSILFDFVTLGLAIAPRINSGAFRSILER